MSAAPDFKAIARELNGRSAVSGSTLLLVILGLLVALVVWADASSPLTAACAWTYLAARVLYIPAYAFGWVPWRSVLWAIGLLSTVILICAALV